MTIRRVHCLVFPVGRIDIYRFAAQNPGAHVNWLRARSKHSIFPASAGRACSQACPVCTRHRPSERLSLPGQSHRDLSICSAKPRRARRLAARALETFDFPASAGKSCLQACPACIRPRPSVLLGLPSRWHRDLSICSAKPRRARRLAARALETFGRCAGDCAAPGPPSSALPEETSWAGAAPGAATPCGIWAAHRATSS